MDLKSKINQDFQVALKQKDQPKIDVLRLLKSAITNKEKSGDSKGKLSDGEIIKIVSKEISQRSEAAKIYEDAEKKQAAEKEKQEKQILEEYMPEQISDQELEKIIDQVIEEAQASNMQDMGKVMSKVMIQVSGQADGKKVSQIVQKKLAG